MGKARNLAKLGALIQSDGKMTAAGIAAGAIPASNDASALTMGTLSAARIGDGSLDASKFSSAAFLASLSAAGYQKLPNGLIMQWGTSGTVGTGNNVTGNQGPISFPIAFPNAVLTLQGTGFNASAISGGAGMSTIFNNITKTSFYWQFAAPNNGCNGFSTFATKWLAFGY